MSKKPLDDSQYYLRMYQNKKKELISEFVEKLKGKWKYLTVHMYENHFEPDFEED